MTKEMPGSLKTALKNDGYEAKAWACADLGQGTDCGECSREENIYTVLTQDSLLIYKAQRREKCRTYSGYFEKRAHMKAAIQPETPVLSARYLLSSLGNPKTENLVAGGCLTVEKDGVRHLVCVFSGQYLRPMTRFCASLEKVCALNGAEDKPQDGGAREDPADPAARENPAARRTTRCPAAPNAACPTPNATAGYARTVWTDARCLCGCWAILPRSRSS